MPALTAEIVINDTLQDLESFFYYSAKFRVKRELNSNCALHASVIGKGAEFRVRFSKDFCKFEINSISDLLFCQIIICHELSHYLNKHNNHSDTDKIDYTALESWADFFGARIFMTIYTFGYRTRMHLGKFLREITVSSSLESIGGALRKVHDSIYAQNTDSRYPPALTRVFLFSAGVTSFFYRYYDGSKPIWIANLILKMINATELNSGLYRHDLDWANQEKLIERFAEIHKSIQKYNPAITIEKLKKKYTIFLVTNYQISEAESAFKKAAIEKNMQPLIDILESKLA